MHTHTTKGLRRSMKPEGRDVTNFPGPTSGGNWLISVTSGRELPLGIIGVSHLRIAAPWCESRRQSPCHE